MPSRRIVVAMMEPPLPFGNAAARWFYVLLRGLVARGHRVTALAACGDPDDAERARALFPAPEFDLRLFAPPGPRGLLGKLDSARRPYSYLFGPEVRHAVAAEMARGVDILHLEQHWTGWLGEPWADRALLHIHYLFEIDLAERPSWPPAQLALQVATRRAERHLLRRYPNVSTLSPRLTEAVRRISPGTTASTVPLGLDPSLYPYPPTRLPFEGPPTLGLIGSFNWQPTYGAGVRLLTRLWPRIKRRVPATRLMIVGRRARAMLGQLVDAAGPDVEVHEDVPDAVPYFRSLDALLYAPTVGSGMKVKVLEAFALGIPVVTTSEGVEGLPAFDGLHAGIAEDDTGLVRRTVDLLTDHVLRHRRRRAARALLEAHCGPGPTLDCLEAVYTRMIAARAGRSALVVAEP